MKWVTYGKINSFYSETYDFLVAKEACNNLLLSLTQRLSEMNVSPLRHPFMFALKDGDQILNCGFQVEPFNLLLAMAEPSTFVDLAQFVADQDCHFPGVSGLKPGTETFIKRWSELTQQPVSLYKEQIVYELQKVTSDFKLSSGFMRMASISEAPLVTEWLLNFGEASDIQGFEANHRLAKNMISERRLLLWVDDDEIVSMAGFGGETPHGSRINAVYTPPQHRGMGYATSLVSELTRLLLSLGRKSCYLFTDKKNTSTRNLYEKIGFQVACEAQEWKVDSFQTNDSLDSTD